ncbi:MAG: PAS domain S-box protein [Planctomycetales bacterium]|nr:PAS domain S-box protein [Planctomycetales bacterium]
MLSHWLSDRRIAWIGLLLALSILLLDITMPLGIAAEVSLLVLVLLSLFSPRPSVTYHGAIIATVVGFTGGVLSPHVEGWQIVLVNRSLAAFAVWVTAVLCIRQKRTVQRLHDERDRLAHLSAIVQSSEDAIIGLSLDGHIVSCNDSARQLYGYSDAEAQGQPISLLVPADTAAEFDQVLERARQGHSTDHFDTEHVRHGGQRVSVSINVSPLRDSEGVLNGLSFIARDISDRKRAEAQAERARRRILEQSQALATQTAALRRANEKAERASRAKSEFLANMSHEIRTPMTAILGFADVLYQWGDETELPAEQVEAISTIKRNGEHLLSLINDILDISKIEAGKLSVEKIECATLDLLADVEKLMRVRADAKNIPLKIECRGAVPATIHTDPTRLRQILINLVGNALKFTESGEVRVIASFDDRAANIPRMRFEVVDTGIGMSASEIASLFRPFTQADASMTRRFGGTGLGLTISKRLAEKLGGTIEVESVPNQGSTFRVTIATGAIDAVPLVSQNDLDRTNRRVAARAVSQDRPQLDCRVLLAEDGPDNQRLVSFVLRKAGAHVTIAENGQVAFELAMARQQGDDPTAEPPFDVVLMDMQMPVLDGYGATRKLREHGFTGPVIALTAHAMNGDREKCLDAGCDDFATKPIDRLGLLRMIAHYAERTELSHA